MVSRSTIVVEEVLIVISEIRSFFFSIVRILLVFSSFLLNVSIQSIYLCLFLISGMSFLALRRIRIANRQGHSKHPKATRWVSFFLLIFLLFFTFFSNYNKCHISTMNDD